MGTPMERRHFYKAHNFLSRRYLLSHWLSQTTMFIYADISRYVVPFRLVCLKVYSTYDDLTSRLDPGNPLLKGISQAQRSYGDEGREKIY